MTALKNKSWSDGKKFVFEAVLLYGAALTAFILLDPFINLFYLVFHSGLHHPVGYGKIQVIGIIVSSIQLIRNLDRWRFYC